VKPIAANGNVPSRLTKKVSAIAYELSAINPMDIGTANALRCCPTGPVVNLGTMGSIATVNGFDWAELFTVVEQQRCAFS
jgi:hypothetical protein